jgi:hypothetical protein
MGNFSRWLDYAKTKVEMAVRSGHRELDELEAEREASTADKPWLRAEGEAPTFDEARARIEWQAKQAAEGGTPPAPGSAGSATGPSAGSTPGSGPAAEPASPAPAATPADPATPTPPIASPEDRVRDAEAASARLELEARQRESAARLDAIREELGIDPPPTP